MATIELICIFGMLVEKKQKNVPAWHACEDYQNKLIHLCLDCLSLDRGRSFQKRLVKKSNRLVMTSKWRCNSIKL